MNLRRKAAETMDSIADASIDVRDAAAIQTLTLGILCIGVIIAIGLGVRALGR